MRKVYLLGAGLNIILGKIGTFLILKRLLHTTVLLAFDNFLLEKNISLVVVCAILKPKYHGDFY